MSSVKGEAAEPAGGSFLFDRASFVNSMLPSRRPSTDGGPTPFWDFDGRAHLSDQPLPPPPGQEPRASFPAAAAAPDGPNAGTLDRETRWTHVRRLSAQLQKLVTEVPSAGELSKEAYYEMYNAAVSLVRAVDTLDPDRSQHAARSSEVFMPSGSFSLALAAAAPGGMSGSAPTTAGADLDWLSRRSMDLFPRASFSLPNEPPQLPVPAPPPAPGPASASASGASAHGGVAGGQIPASTPHSQSLPPQHQHLQLPPPPQGPPQSAMPPQANGQPPLLGMQYGGMGQGRAPQSQPPSQPPQPQQQQAFFGVSGPFVMNPGPYVMQSYLPSFPPRPAQPGTASPNSAAPPSYYPSRFLTGQLQMTPPAGPQQGQGSFPLQPPMRQSAPPLPPVIRTTSSSQPTEIIFTSGDDPKTKRRGATGTRRNLRCQMCNVTETPEWRRGPDGEHTLCNACGLHYAKVLKRDKANKMKRRKHSIDAILNKDSQKPDGASVVPAAAAAALAARGEQKSSSGDDDSRKSNE